MASLLTGGHQAGLDVHCPDQPWSGMPCMARMACIPVVLGPAWGLAAAEYIPRGSQRLEQDS